MSDVFQSTPESGHMYRRWVGRDTLEGWIQDEMRRLAGVIDPEDWPKSDPGGGYVGEHLFVSSDVFDMIGLHTRKQPNHAGALQWKGTWVKPW